MGRLFALLILPLAAAGVSDAVPQQRALDQGTLVITLDGTPIGRERFVVRAGRASAPDGFTISAQVTLGPEALGPALVPLVELGPDSLPVSAQIEERGERVRRVLAQVGGRRLMVRAVSPSGESVREYPAGERLLIADDSSFALYAVPPGASPGAVRLVWLRSDRREVWELDDRGVETLALGAASLPARHLVLRADGRERHLWYDERGRLLKVEIPGAGLAAVRQTPE